MALVFASNNVNGFNVMKSTMLNLSKNIYFEYKTHEQNVLTIFSGHEIDIAISEMANVMLRDLKGKSLSRAEVDLYCKYHDFIPDDMTVKILKCLSLENKIVLIKDGIKKKNPKKFPQGTIIEFCG